MVRPQSCRVIYYFDTPALGIRHQSFVRVITPKFSSCTSFSFFLEKMDSYKVRSDSRSINIISPSILRGFYERERSPPTLIFDVPNTISVGEVLMVDNLAPVWPSSLLRKKESVRRPWFLLGDALKL